MKEYLHHILCWFSSDQLVDIEKTYVGYVHSALPTIENRDQIAKTINNKLTSIKTDESSPEDVRQQLINMNKPLEVVVKPGNTEIGGRVYKTKDNSVILLGLKSQETVLCECLSFISETTLRPGLSIIPKHIKNNIKGPENAKKLVDASIKYTKTLTSIPVKNMSQECIDEKY